MRTFAVLGVFLVGALSLPAAAAAATSQYAPNADSRTFAGSAGGWAGETVYTNGLCVAGVTCPAVDNVFVAGNGTGGAADGFIRSEVNGLLSLLSTTRATWHSPQFVFAGAQGNAPSTLTFDLARRTNADSLLALLSDAKYSVLLDDVSTGGSVEVVSPTTIMSLPSWARNATVQLVPSQLKVGDTYSIRIVTQLDMPIAVIPSGTFDYDDVVLTASTAAGTAPLAEQLGKELLGNKAKLRGKHLYVPVRCPASAPASCQVRLVGYLKGRTKKATKTGKVNVAPGAKKIAKLRVKPKFLSRVERRKKMVFRARVTSGSTHVTIYKQLKILHR